MHTRFWMSLKVQLNNKVLWIINKLFFVILLTVLKLDYYNKCIHIFLWWHKVIFLMNGCVNLL